MDISAIGQFTKKSITEKIDCIKKSIGKKQEEFDFEEQKNIPVLIHKRSGLEFVFVPGGNYWMGLSEENQRAAEKISPIVNANYEEMRPVREVSVSSFLVTRTPVLNEYINKNEKDGKSPFYCSYSEAEKIAKMSGMRLLKEAEWEYLARSGKRTLFPFGDELPEEKELEKWMIQDFSDLSNYNCNCLGIYGLFTGEWTSDFYKITYDEKSSVLPCRVIRGGGAYFWPWQDEEWVWCISAMRMPSDGLIDDECTFRLVYEF